MQKKIVGLNFNFTEAKFHNWFWHNFLCTILFSADTGNNRKIVKASNSNMKLQSSYRR